MPADIGGAPYAVTHETFAEISLMIQLLKFAIQVYDRIRNRANESGEKKPTAGDEKSRPSLETLVASAEKLNSSMANLASSEVGKKALSLLLEKVEPTS